MHKFALIVFLFALALPVLGFAKTKQVNQFHFRTGVVNGSYTGKFRGDWRAPIGFDLDYEIYYRSTRSYFFRFTTAMDDPASRPFYTYAGGGHRWYFNSKGRYAEYSDEDLSMQVTPVWRYFASADIGTAQIIVKTFGEVLQAVANMLEIGAHVGATYNFNKSLGVEAQAGGTLGYGYSSVAANGKTTRIFVGLNYSF